jgi:L-rhamnose isomerase
MFVDEILLHVSRGVRWDSDHVVTYNDELQAIASEIIRNNFDSRVHIGLDYFDASINRVAAWIIGSRNMYKALLAALLEPAKLLADAERNGDNTTRLALMEDAKSMPFGAIWDEYCKRCNAPGNIEWLKEVKAYEAKELSKR